MCWNHCCPCNRFFGRFFVCLKEEFEEEVNATENGKIECPWCGNKETAIYHEKDEKVFPEKDEYEVEL